MYIYYKSEFMECKYTLNENWKYIRGIFFIQHESLLGETSETRPKSLTRVSYAQKGAAEKKEKKMFARAGHFSRRTSSQERRTKTLSSAARRRESSGKTSPSYPYTEKKPLPPQYEAFQ